MTILTISVTASNCVPLKPHLQRIFFKEDHLKPTAQEFPGLGAVTGASAGTSSATPSGASTAGAPAASDKDSKDKDNKDKDHKGKDTEEGESDKKKHNEFHIAEQVSGIRQQFVFPDPLARPSPARPDSNNTHTLTLTLTLSNNNNKDKDSGKVAAGTGTGASPSPSPSPHAALILDVPLGMRLLNSYRLGYKDKVMRMWKTGMKYK